MTRMVQPSEPAERCIILAIEHIDTVTQRSGAATWHSLRAVLVIKADVWNEIGQIADRYKLQ